MAIMTPIHYRLDNVSVSIDPAEPKIGDATFAVENHWHLYHLRRDQLERLRRGISTQD